METYSFRANVKENSENSTSFFTTVSVTGINYASDEEARQEAKLLLEKSYPPERYMIWPIDLLSIKLS